jgi:hypothetical protein
VPVEHPRQEAARTEFATAFSSTFPAASAFRCKTPYTMARQRRPYVYIVSLVTTAAIDSDHRAFEYILGRVVDDGKAEFGLELKEKWWEGEDVALFPMPVPLTDDDMKTADAALEWYPPIHPVRAPERTETSPNQGPAVVQRLSIRPVDWKRHESAWTEWMQTHAHEWSWTAATVQDWAGCTSIEISILLVK